MDDSALLRGLGRIADELFCITALARRQMRCSKSKHVSAPRYRDGLHTTQPIGWEQEGDAWLCCASCPSLAATHINQAYGGAMGSSTQACQGSRQH